MSKSLSLKQQQLDETNIEIRKTILPKLNSLITSAANNIIDNTTMHVIDISGKTLPEIEQMISNLKYEVSCQLNNEIRFELSKLLFATVHPDESAEQVSQEQHIQQAAESNHDGYNAQANAVITEEQALAPVFEPSNESMPISVVRSIILERVDADTIERIIHLNAQGMSIAQMRSKGIKLADQVIETIIDDYATDETGDPVEPPGYDSKTMRNVRKLYKNGHTVEYIASRTKLHVNDVNEIVSDINPLDISCNYATLAMIQAHKAANAPNERIANACGLRLAAVELSINSSQ